MTTKKPLKIPDGYINEIEVDSTWREKPSAAYQAYRKRYEELKDNPARTIPEFPLSIEIETSYFCNLKCPFCARVVGEGERNIKHLSPELWQKILKEAKENKMPSILMDHEGEALMNPKLISMVREAKEAGIIDIWLHTNGMLMTEQKAEELIDAGLTKVNFSLDASQEETYKKLRVGGDFKRVHGNIHGLLNVKKRKNAEYLRVRVSFCLQKSNAPEAPEFFQQWKDKVNLITFQNCVDMSVFEGPDSDEKLTEQELEAKYKNTAENFTCNQPWTMPIIDVDGNVVPCGMPVREHNKDFFLGNLMAGDTIKDCWNGEKMNKLRELHMKKEYYKNSMCRACVKACSAAAKVTNTLTKGENELPQARPLQL